jgi:general secretion pathway protein M
VSLTARLPEGRPGRLLAVALLGIGLLLLWLGIAAPLLAAHAEGATRLDRKAQILHRSAALVASLPALRASVAALPADGTQGEAWLAGASDAVAGAALQTMLQQITAGSRDIQLASLEMLPVEELGGYRRIGLRVSGRGSWRSVLDMLAQIDAARPVLLVDGLSLRAPTARLARSVPDLPVELSFALHAFRNPEATP